MTGAWDRSGSKERELLFARGEEEKITMFGQSMLISRRCKAGNPNTRERPTVGTPGEDRSFKEEPNKTRGKYYRPGGGEN